ncbi:MAG: cytidylate kinase family protein [Propionibacteriaceae bacterium]|jgi:predicted cytidylate kinase|nr:cytidylate kinase family protein [Propionibacteriaceae bacterium]
MPPTTSQPPYHLTISGDLGSGKSTGAQLIAAALDLDVLSTGDIHRSIARARGMSALGANYAAEADPTIDEQIDSTTVRVAREAAKPIVFDSRMAWFFVENALRVRLVVDPAVAATRVLARAATDVESYTSLTDVATSLAERAEVELRRYLETYGVDIADLTHFDLVIDTSEATPGEVADEIIAALGRPRPERTVLRLSPARVVPRPEAARGGELMVEFVRPVFYAVAGVDELATGKGQHLVTAGLATTNRAYAITLTD